MLSLYSFMRCDPPLPPPPPQVILTLLHYHQDFVLQCRSMEAITHYLKEQLPAHVLDNMPTIFSDALRVDLGSKLQAFETEYQIMAELTASFQIDMETPPSLESLNNLLKKQNRELIEQLAICRGSIRGLESTVSSLQAEVDEQRDRIQRSVGLVLGSRDWRLTYRALCLGDDITSVVTVLAPFTVQSWG